MDLYNKLKKNCINYSSHSNLVAKKVRFPTYILNSFNCLITN
jgi:hypothetical protein